MKHSLVMHLAHFVEHARSCKAEDFKEREALIVISNIVDRGEEHLGGVVAGNLHSISWTIYKSISQNPDLYKAMRFAVKKMKRDGPIQEDRLAHLEKTLRAKGVDPTVREGESLMDYMQRMKPDMPEHERKMTEALSKLFK